MQVLLHSIPGLDGPMEEGPPLEDAPEGYLTKRPYRPLHAGETTGSHIDDVKLALSRGYHVIIMVRDGRDVMVSRRPTKPDEYYIKRSDEWCAAFDTQVNPFLGGHRDVTIVRYEDLVKGPEEVVGWIASRLDLPSPRDLRGELSRVPDTSMLIPAMRWQRSISLAHIGQWKQDKRRIASLVANYGIRERMCRGLEALGYENDREWLSDLEGILA